MTNKEAIDRLSIMQGRCENGYDEEALDLAIKALEERPTGEWEKSEAHEDIGYDRGFRDGYAQAVEERPCNWENDEEGRNHEQRYENLKKLRSFHNGSYAKGLDNAIKALEEKVNDPRNDPHYDECDYCKYNDSSDDYPCSECKYRSKWEAIE